MGITAETRRQSYHAVLPSLNERQKNVLDVLKYYGDSTAREVAIILYLRGIVRTDERNTAAPRLTELTKKGLTQVVGKKVCCNTGRRVAVWSLAEGVEQ